LKKSKKINATRVADRRKSNAHVLTAQTLDADMEVCILAGGLSTRMGSDKSRLRLGRFTILGLIRRSALTLGLPVRTVKRDLVLRCGPLGGIYTALKRSKAPATVFLSCDMPFISPEFLAWLIKQFVSQHAPVFSTEGELAGFPFILRAQDLPIVNAQLGTKTYSLQKLVTALNAKRLNTPRKFASDLLNLNTPADWQLAQTIWSGQSV
jgi:molybdopterin-guanine dinucleotide biosynthesis protein A